jgi:hypothetical protein
MIQEKYLKIKVSNRNVKYYNDNVTICKSGDIINVPIDKLIKKSKQNITAICDVCGYKKNMKFADYNKITKNGNEKYFCRKCKFIKTKKTNLEKYGVENPFQNENIKEKIKNTNLKKYGVDYYSKTDEYKKKSMETNLKKYGEIHPMKNNTIINKMKKTNLDKYGTEYSLLNNNVRLKIINTNIKKYGIDIPTKNKKIIEKIKKTNLDRYGYKSPTENENIIKLSIDKLFANYGVYNPMKSDIIKKKSKDTKIKNILKKLKNYNIISIDDDFNYIFKCMKKDHTFQISSTNLYNRLKINTELCTICNPLNSYHSSGFEIQLKEFIKENYNENILFNDRSIGKELDIYIPELKLAFEFNGLYWHNEINKPNKYHLEKTELCEEKGIQIIHIYEDDWIYRQDIVKSMILNKLGKTINKIYARKTEIREIQDNKLVREFLEHNHIQGFIGSKVKVGLFYENELVSLMTFGKRRVSMGKKISQEGEYELLRFCSRLDTNVVGGANKLFKYFKENYRPKFITTYADRSWSTGGLYYNLGLKFKGKTDPNYYYIIDGLRYHRFGFRKDVLVKEGYDSNKTEHEIMLDRGIYRIYDSGNLKFELNF